MKKIKYIPCGNWKMMGPRERQKAIDEGALLVMTPDSWEARERESSHLNRQLDTLSEDNRKGSKQLNELLQNEKRLGELLQQSQREVDTLRQRIAKAGRMAHMLVDEVCGTERVPVHLTLDEAIRKLQVRGNVAEHYEQIG